MNFKTAVEKSDHLSNAFRQGLQALRKRDRRHIKAEDTRRITGSVDVDSAYATVDPQASRWDFGVAYQHTNRNDEVVYWVETHTASSSEIETVLQKAAWLQQWFQAKGKYLARFEKDMVWVSSGSTRLTLSDPKRKRMAELGLRCCGQKLHLPNERAPV